EGEADGRIELRVIVCDRRLGPSHENDGNREPNEAREEWAANYIGVRRLIENAIAPAALLLDPNTLQTENSPPTICNANFVERGIGVVSRFIVRVALHTLRLLNGGILAVGQMIKSRTRGNRL